MKDYTTKLLGLEDVIVKNVWEDEVSRHIEIELPRKEHRCPCCGELTDKVHDYRSQCIKDCPAFGKQVYLHLRKRRYVCSACGKCFYESNSFVPRYYRVTSCKCAQIINDFRETVSAATLPESITYPSARRCAILTSCAMAANACQRCELQTCGHIAEQNIIFTLVDYRSFPAASLLLHILKALFES